MATIRTSINRTTKTILEFKVLSFYHLIQQILHKLQRPTQWWARRSAKDKKTKGTRVVRKLRKRIRSVWIKRSKSWWFQVILTYFSTSISTRWTVHFQ